MTYPKPCPHGEFPTDCERCQQAAEIARLTAERDLWRKIANQLAAEIVRLMAEVEGLRKDAERYRWMRQHGYLALANGDLLDEDELMHVGPRLDAAIDAARGET